MSSTEPDLEWDTFDVSQAEINYRKENKEDFYPDNPNITDEEIENRVYEDYDLITFAYDDFINYFQELLDHVTKKYKETYYWTAEVEGFGWRGQSGEMDVFYEEDVRELLRRILPQCDCNYKIFMNRTGFRLQNFHHDSPVGNEWYTIRHITNKEFLKSEYN